MMFSDAIVIGGEAILVPEGSDTIGTRLWPSSVVMSHFILFHQQRMNDKVLMEMGSGTSLPSLVACKFSSPSKVYLQDFPNEEITGIQKRVFEKNRVDDKNVETISFGWGEMPELIQKIDLVYSSDSLYQGKGINVFLLEHFRCSPVDFGDFMSSIAYLLNVNPKCTFITCYHERKYESIFLHRSII